MSASRRAILGGEMAFFLTLAAGLLAGVRTQDPIQDAPQTGLIQEDRVIQALAPN
jgi:hypothetical protein